MPGEFASRIVEDCEKYNVASGVNRVESGQLYSQQIGEEIKILDIITTPKSKQLQVIAARKFSLQHVLSFHTYRTSIRHPLDRR